MNQNLDSEEQYIEEQYILEHFERGALLPAPDSEKEMATARLAAQNTFNRPSASTSECPSGTSTWPTPALGKRECPTRPSSPA